MMQRRVSNSLISIAYEEMPVNRNPLSSVSRMMIFAVVALVFLLPMLATTPAKADVPTDGRINLIPWVNSWGAVAVYCVDQNGGHSSYTGGRIEVRSAIGQILMTVPEAQIVQAGVNPRHPVVIASGSLYTLSRLPDTAFQLTSKPDNEGKTFIGKWYGCIPVGPAAPAESLACYTPVMQTEEGWIEACTTLCWSEGPYPPICGGQDRVTFCYEYCIQE